MSEENNNQMPPEKMDLMANREVPLSLYVYIVRPGLNNVVPTDQNVSLMAAYTADEAMAALGAKFPAGQALTIDFKGSFLMTQILQMFRQTMNLEATRPESDIVTRTKKDFYKEIIEGMLKDVQPFVEKPEDAPVLENALKKMLSLVQ